MCGPERVAASEFYHSRTRPRGVGNAPHARGPRRDTWGRQSGAQKQLAEVTRVDFIAAAPAPSNALRWDFTAPDRADVRRDLVTLTRFGERKPAPTECAAPGPSFRFSQTVDSRNISS